MTAKLNYLDPVFVLSLSDKENAERRLSFSQHQEVYQVKGPAGSQLPYCTSLSVQTTLGTSNMIRATLDVPKQYFEPMMDEWFDLFTPGQIIEAQIGYQKGNLLTRPFSASMTSLPRVSGGMDFFSIEVEGKGSLWFSSRRSSSFSTNGRTILAVIKDICRNYGVQIYRLTGEGREELIASSAADAQLSNLNQTLDEVMMGTEFSVVRDLIIVRAQLGFYISGNRFVIYNPALQRQQQRDYTFELNLGQVDPNKAVYPIATFSSRNASLPFAKGTGSISTNDQDVQENTPAKRETIDRNDDRINLRQTRPNSRPDGVTDTNEAFGDRPNVPSLKLPLSSTDPAAESKLLYEKRRAEEISGSQMEWTTPGLPIILPGEIANLVGLSFLYDGRYQIQTVTHRISTAGYDTTLMGVAPGQSPGATSILTDLANRVTQQQEFNERRNRLLSNQDEVDISENPVGLQTRTPGEGLA